MDTYKTRNLQKGQKVKPNTTCGKRPNRDNHPSLCHNDQRAPKQYKRILKQIDL